MNNINCEEAKIHHAWEDITPSYVMPSFPPQHPDKVRRCKNCGLTQSNVITQREIREWRDHKNT